METIVILGVAAGISAAVVWWASIPPGSMAFRRQRPSRRAARDAALSFRETFQTTGPEPAPVRPVPDDGFITVQQAVPDDRPPRILSLLRIALAIGLVAALGVAVVALLGFLLKLQLDKYLGGG
jgi:hypothetical protein